MARGVESGAQPHHLVRVRARVRVRVRRAVAAALTMVVSTMYR